MNRSRWHRWLEYAKNLVEFDAGVGVVAKENATEDEMAQLAAAVEADGSVENDAKVGVTAAEAKADVSVVAVAADVPVNRHCPDRRHRSDVR